MEVLRIQVKRGETLRVNEHGPHLFRPLNCALSQRIDETEVALILPGKSADAGKPFNVVALNSGTLEATEDELDTRLVARNVVCVVNHTASQRLARRLLALNSLFKGRWIEVNQGELARHLSIRRQWINVQMRRMELQKLIECRRNRVLVTGFELLYQMSCECHRWDSE